MRIASIERLLKVKLGECYGGPSIGYHKDSDMFVVYTWQDAPVSYCIEYKSKTLKGLLDQLAEGD